MKRPMRVLVACEMSARVRDAFRMRGHDAWSVDVLPTLGDPRWHIQGDALEVLAQPWDLLIAFPPCTHLSKAGARHWKVKVRDGRQDAGAAFFLEFAWAFHIPMRCVENPAGVMTRYLRAPDQYIEPYWFGDPWRKQTGLWLWGLPPLVPTCEVEPAGYWVPGRHARASGLFVNELKSNRSMTFHGVACAMAEQWG
jgi:hypothetical protein